MNPDFFAPLELRSEHLCDVHIDAAAAGVGRIDSPWGAMLVDYIADGEFAGPELRGRVLPGGGDWPAVSGDGKGSLRIDARGVWQTDDGAKIYVRYEGFIVLPEREGKGLLDMPAADPSSYYFRTAPVFRTGDERYLWLNKIVCVGVGRFAPGGVGYRIYRID
jgi:hypothetical protein